MNDVPPRERIASCDTAGDVVAQISNVFLRRDPRLPGMPSAATSAMATTTFEKVSDNISHGLHQAGERIIDFKDDAARDLGRRVDALGALMKKHPLASIGIGLAAGYVLARIIHRG